MIPIDAGSLAKELTPYLLQLLPYLQKGAKIVGEEALKVLNEEGRKSISDSAKALWRRLWPKIESDPAAAATVEKAAAAPTDERIQPALEFQLESLLGDETFRAEIAALLEGVKKEGVVISSELEIEEHAGEAVGLDVQSGEELRQANVKEITQRSKIARTEKGSKFTGVRFGHDEDLGSHPEESDSINKSG
jgi:hypothetical protein